MNIKIHITQTEMIQKYEQLDILFPFGSIIRQQWHLCPKLCMYVTQLCLYLKASTDNNTGEKNGK